MDLGAMGKHFICNIFLSQCFCFSASRRQSGPVGSVESSEPGKLHLSPFSVTYGLCDLEQVTFSQLLSGDGNNYLPCSLTLFEVINRCLLIESGNQYVYHLFVNLQDYRYLLIHEYATLWLSMFSHKNCLACVSAS